MTAATFSISRALINYAALERHHSHLAALLLAPLLMLLALPGHAQTDVDTGDEQGLTLETGQGRILRFSEAAASVFVADPEVADVQVVSQGVLYLFGKSQGDTNLIVLSDDDRTQASMRLQVRDGARIARQALRGAGADAPIRLRMAGNQLVAEGDGQDVSSAIATQSTLESHAPQAGETLDNTTYEGGTQINLRVRFAEVSREELLQYGVSWSALINNGSFSLGVFPGSQAGNTFGTLGAGADSVDGLLQALQENDLLQILAEPNITAVTGETASFLAGGEIPIPVPVSRDLVGIEYKQFGVSLLFTPALLPNDRISLQVRPEVSSLTGSSVEIGGLSVPGLQVRRADTLVEVGSGQTFAIAGLFQRDTFNNVERIPGLGDIPILGNLFRSRRFQRNETELVILITPYIVEPSSAPTPRTPLDQARVTGDDGRLDTRITYQVERDDPFGFHLQ
ncbi:type II and III secretion system protein family protein [Halomonas kalidii]|uniref:Type II and III secretion system protein family protein n=1 Tax=Halomonas kalidii TaxID=3043293 RepID=A0ABT6VNU9_9GAMM|nr:type II and III secretion system protein family protein [Halomonas kalidii]MDI5935662.1 type II and III secretion system protein family protein [Halomonas kalidii]